MDDKMTKSALDLLPGYVRDAIAARSGRLRADLLVIPDAEAAGWIVEFRNDHWHNGAEFQRGDVVVWETGRDYRRNTFRNGGQSGRPESFPYTLTGLRTALGLEVSHG